MILEYFITMHFEESNFTRLKELVKISHHFPLSKILHCKILIELNFSFKWWKFLFDENGWKGWSVNIYFHRKQVIFLYIKPILKRRQYEFKHNLFDSFIHILGKVDMFFFFFFSLHGYPLFEGWHNAAKDLSFYKIFFWTKLVSFQAESSILGCETCLLIFWSPVYY